ncbi:hypothetical protein GLP40_29865 [Nocardia sp. CT2-14]|uniref:Resolvase/invertase-type recombinase catalytic domain-containing protein n=1 Tax=Nocardia aurantiaca TaxID=2675850 RepID=A0A6I3L870_9NOCA|nr:hypothetical protein [Nocardia aurantiaca]
MLGCRSGVDPNPTYRIPAGVGIESVSTFSDTCRCQFSDSSPAHSHAQKGFRVAHGQRIGYIRVSTDDQNTERQLDGVPVDKTFTDKASGKDRERPQLTALLDYVRDGDTVVVHSMDRLARSLDDLRQLVRGLTEQQIKVEFVKEGLTFIGDDTPMANLLLTMMGAVAEFERALLGTLHPST